MDNSVSDDSSAIEQLSSDLLGLVLLKSLLLSASTNEHNETYTIYVTLTSVSRGWRQTITGQLWYHATPTQPVLFPDSDVDECDGPGDVTGYDVITGDHVIYEDEFVHCETTDDVDALVSSIDDDRDYQELVLSSPRDSVNVDDKLLFVVNEIISTEQTYIKRLRLLNKDFREELELQNGTKRMMSEKTMTAIFSNIDSIYKLHLQLFKQLLQQPFNVTQCRVGGVFCTFAHYLKMYAVYLNNVEPARRLLNQLVRRSRDFDQFIKRFEQRPDFERLKVDTFLQEPIARIPRYELLLKQYLKYLPSNSFDRRDTERAIEMVHKAAVHADRYLQQSVQKQRLVELAGQLRSSDASITIIRPGCQLLREDSVRVANLSGKNEFSEKTALLFTDQLLVCDCSFFVTQHLSLNGMKVLNEDEELTMTVTLRAQQSAVKLMFRSDENKVDWVKAVKDAIGEYAKARHSLLRSFTALAKSIAYSRDELGVMAPVWVADYDALLCMVCGVEFGWIAPRRHHCRACGVVVCRSCSHQCAPLAYRSYRRSRVCDNCDVILSHKARRGLRCYDNASPAAGPPTEDADACLSTIVEELLERNNQPLCHSVGANSAKATVSGYLTVGNDNWMSECSRRWFELHRDGVLYSFSRLTSSEAMTATVLHGYTLLQRQNDASADSDNEWQFALVRGPGLRKTSYVRADTAQQLERWIKELKIPTSQHCNLLQNASFIDIVKNAVDQLLS